MNTFGSNKHRSSRSLSLREEYLEGEVGGKVGVYTPQFSAYIRTYLKQ